MSDLRDVWEATGAELEKLQAAVGCVSQERAGLSSRTPPAWTLSFAPKPTVVPVRPRSCVAVLRQEGSNGDREMAAALHAGGLEPWDVSMTDLISGAVTLDRFRGIVFVGGFSYADVLDSAKGWAAVLKFKEELAAQLDAFYRRKDSFSLGVCNGCQLMALLGWVPGSGDETKPYLDIAKQPRFIHNSSGRFEARFSSVTILESPAVLLKGMAGTSLGVWVAHGEGKSHFPEASMLPALIDKRMAPIRYVDDSNKQTETYPFNPNGSPHGIAALCSEDGRHLAMMPHPERCFVKWQLPWMPPSWDALEAAPWLKLFQNAAAFCNAEE
uniref:Phosphoribosylformylglycinamidine synthase n=1 Tax=Haptolina ericina TaxID=156174 RepID=A0A7S3AV45_9EUKA